MRRKVGKGGKKVEIVKVNLCLSTSALDKGASTATEGTSRLFLQPFRKVRERERGGGGTFYRQFKLFPGIHGLKKT